MLKHMSLSLSLFISLTTLTHAECEIFKFQKEQGQWSTTPTYKIESNGQLSEIGSDGAAKIEPQSQQAFPTRYRLNKKKTAIIFDRPGESKVKRFKCDGNVILRKSMRKEKFSNFLKFEGCDQLNGQFIEYLWNNPQLSEISVPLNEVSSIH